MLLLFWVALFFHRGNKRVEEESIEQKSSKELAANQRGAKTHLSEQLSKRKVRQPFLFICWFCCVRILVCCKRLDESSRM